MTIIAHSNHHEANEQDFLEMQELLKELETEADAEFEEELARLREEAVCEDLNAEGF